MKAKKKTTSSGTHLSPILCNFGEMQALTQINQVQDVLLETTSSKSNAGFEEFRSNSGVQSTSVTNFINISTSSFTDSTKCIDARNSLG